MHPLIIAAMLLLVAVLYSSVGHAGASGYLAVMALAGMDAAVMKPTALVLNILVASIGSWRFVRARCFSFALLWPFTVTSIPMALIGGGWKISEPIYKLILGLVLLWAAGNIIWRSLRPLKSDSDESPVRVPPLWLAMICGGGIGLLSGLIGVGGGIFLSPLILIMRWANPRVTAGVSAVFILVNSISGLLGNIASVRALPDEIPLWLGAAVVGGLIGTWLGVHRLSGAMMRWLLALVLAIAAWKLIVPPKKSVHAPGAAPTVEKNAKVDAVDDAVAVEVG